jgi:hypothetical protein
MTTPERFSDKMFDQQHPRVADGTFTTKAQTAPETALIAAPTVDGPFIERWNEFAGRPTLDSTVAQLVAEELNETRNFSDQNIADNIDAAHTAIHGYTPAVKAKYDFALTTLRRNGFGDSAEDVEAYVGALIAKQEAPEMTDAQAAAATDSITPTSDPRVQAGMVLDTVVAPDGTVFHRRRDTVFPDWPNEIRVQANRKLSEDEQNNLAALVGYAYKAQVRGEQMSDAEFDSPYSLIMGADVTKTASDDAGLALERFEESLTELVAEGSPIRKTDRKGPGTAGTRLIPGFGAGFSIELYYDSVTTD